MGAAEGTKGETVTADDRLRQIAESLLLIEATGAELATFAVEDIRFLLERIEHFKTSRRVWVEDACEQIANADFEPCDNFVQEHSRGSVMVWWYKWQKK